MSKHNFLQVLFLGAVLAGTGCGGGGSSSRDAGLNTAPPTGGITLLAGDHHLDNVEAVIVTIEEVRLLGDGPQEELLVSDLDPINLLDLRNVTEVIAATDVPAGSYSKIRLLISSLEIVEVGNPARIQAQLPANGKIDLNPQGPFEIVGGEDLVVQIDFDLHRSVHLVQTGNGRYRFRPVVFVDVIDQTDNLRLVHLTGTVEDDIADSEASDFDLCEGGLEVGPCYDVQLADGALIVQADGTVATLEELERGAPAHVFGHFFIGATGGEFVRAQIVAMGGEDSLVQISGDVASAVVDDAFDLVEEEGADPTSVQILAGTKLFNDLGQPLDFDIATGQEAEAWAQQLVLDAAEAGQFPAILVQVSIDEAEESVEGALVSIGDGTFDVSNDEGVFCVNVTEDTEIQLLSGYDDDAVAETVDLTGLADVIDSGVEIEAYGVTEGDCLVADFVSAEVESMPAE